MSLDFLFAPFEQLDAWITGLFEGAALLAALGIALVLGLRHASDPDHLVAVTSLIAADRTAVGAAARLGVWWGLGHALVLLAIGLPLVAFRSELPAWLEGGAEKGVALVIVVLAGRVIWKWARGNYRAGAHGHGGGAGLGTGTHRHLHRGGADHGHAGVRSRGQAFLIGALHGVAGTGAVVVVLIAALPTKLEAAVALAVFAPASIASMAAFTGLYAWILTRPLIEPVYRTVLIPALGSSGVLFGLWYAGI